MNERDVIIWDVLIAIISRNILRKFLGWQNLICHACQFKLQNVQRIIYQDLSGKKIATVFLAISRISAGVHERLSSIFVFCDRIWIKQKAKDLIKFSLLKLRHYQLPQKSLNRGK
jgi:hypothetical protein